MYTEKEILNFIDTFKYYHKEEVEDLFLHGCCYWFADILERQFGARKCYSTAENHFVVEINGELYDIRGNITNEYDKPTDDPDNNSSDLIYWDVYQEWEPLDSGRVIKNCKNFID